MEPITGLPLEILLSDGETRVDGLARQLREAIVAGRLAAHIALPASRQFAIHLGVSRNTVTHAYDRLISQGFLYARKGAGTFVSPSTATRRVEGSDTASPRVTIRAEWAKRRTDNILPVQPVCDTDFRIGYPDTRHFPFTEWQRCVTRAQRQSARNVNNDVHPQGHHLLRRAITGHLSRSRAIGCHEDEIIITQGTQHSLTLIASVLINAGKTCVAIESPGYPMAKHVFEAAGAKVVEIEVDKNGLCVDAIPENVDIVYTTPSHQFPLGMPLSLARRIALLSLAAKRGIIIIEDDYDSEIRLGSAPIDALKAMDTQGSVFYLGTMSKVMFPDVRTGYMLAPAWAKEALIAARFLHSWHNPSVTQQALADFITEGHLRRHTSAMTRRYRTRHQLLRDAMARHTRWFSPLPLFAGVHATFQVSSDVDAVGLSEQACRQGVGVMAVAQLGGAPHQFNALVFGLGLVDEERIPAACDMLAALAQRLASE